ncbi:IS3 family transposase [Lentibacillus halodurans]|uniref:IS3 family transposase n=1 Tax=Lentibacillus halodurans TaxID=237679 RepID=UPI003CC7A9B3
MKHRIDEIYTKFPFWGSRRIAKRLNMNRNRVQRHIREMGIQAIYSGPNLNKRNLEHRSWQKI